MTQSIVEIQGLKNNFGGRWIHSDVNLTIYPQEILGIIGGSGSGKTTLLRCILMLLKPTAGIIKLFGQDISHLNESSANQLRQRFGMMFQHSALFSALNILENILFPMRKLSQLPEFFIRELAFIKLGLVGLKAETAYLMPSELSGGMQRRAAAARAIAMDPELLFLDEPTSGLDPLSAKLFDQLLIFLRDTLNLTLIIISHDIESLERTTDRVAFIGEGQILALEPLSQLKKNKHPMIADYFSKI